MLKFQWFVIIIMVATPNIKIFNFYFIFFLNMKIFK